MTAQPTLSPVPALRPMHWHVRGSLGTTLVAALYVLLLVASPLLVRFAPLPDHALVTATQVADPVASPRCATAPEFGYTCVSPARGR